MFYVYVSSDHGKSDNGLELVSIQNDMFTARFVATHELGKRYPGEWQTKPGYEDNESVNWGFIPRESHWAAMILPYDMYQKKAEFWENEHHTLTSGMSFNEYCTRMDKDESDMVPPAPDRLYRDHSVRTVAADAESRRCPDGVADGVDSNLSIWKLNLIHACLGVIDDLMCYGELQKKTVDYLKHHTSTKRFKGTLIF